MGDFLGFTFGGYHSSDLGITRVSGGDRYDEQLHPEIKDRTAEVPGLNGEYYFGSDFGSKQFDIEIAYDSLTEEQFRNLRKVFGTKDIKELIFDERPYKRYLAKLESPIELSYICFDEPIKKKFSELHDIGTIDPDSGVSEGVITELPDGVRVTERIPTEDGYEIVREKVDPWVYDYEHTQTIYKGEGKISFICHFPFAKSVYKQLPITEEESDWVISSGILSATERDNRLIDVFSDNQIKVYNPGDVETGFRMYLPAEVANTSTSLTYLDEVNQIIASLYLKPIEMKNTDVGVLIDTNNSLIIGVSEAPLGPSLTDGDITYKTSGNLYNEAVESGQFFKIAPMFRDITGTIQINGGGEGIQIFYDYLYF